MSGFRIQEASWDRDNTILKHIRFLVFVEGQGVPLAEELDGRDPRALHVVALDSEGEAAGTGRLLDGQIGRVAVLEEYRGRGVGRMLLEKLMDMGKEEGLEEIELHAQVEAILFYEKSGFVAEGPEFMDANIPHRVMKRKL